MNTKKRVVRSSLGSQDARYQRNERRIHKAFNTTLTNRRINVYPNEICKSATISRTTFYAHCSNTDDALRRYEVELKARFHDRLPEARCRHDVVFTILLTFVYDKRGYFRATIPNSDFWLLNTIFDDMRTRLVSSNIGDRTYGYYVQTQIVIINDWVAFGKFARQDIPRYVQKLMRTRLIDPSV